MHVHTLWLDDLGNIHLPPFFSFTIRIPQLKLVYFQNQRSKSFSLYICSSLTLHQKTCPRKQQRRRVARKARPHQQEPRPQQEPKPRQRQRRKLRFLLILTAFFHLRREQQHHHHPRQTPSNREVILQKQKPRRRRRAKRKPKEQVFLRLVLLRTRISTQLIHSMRTVTNKRMMTLVRPRMEGSLVATATLTRFLQPPTLSIRR